MGLANAAQGDLPAMTLEPGEFIGGRAISAAAADATEAADIENQAAGIRKRMPVRTVDGNAGAWIGDGLAALPADDPPFTIFV